MSDPKLEHAIESVWWAAVHAVKGEQATRATAERALVAGPLRAVAVGKAAASMMRGLLQAGVEVSAALVLTKDGHSDASLSIYPQLEQWESAHPVPDARSLESGRRLLDFVATESSEPLLLLVSGGASALVECLQPGETLQSLQALNQRMLAAGADIATINRARSELSLIKLGRLAQRCPTRISSWVLSDVAGDDIAVVGSGIGLLPQADEQQVIASNVHARAAAVEAITAMGGRVVLDEECLYGDFLAVADRVAQLLESGPSGWYVLGGEPTVVLPDSPGEGGRNQALAVALSQRLAGRRGIVGLVAGSDGSDGPTRAAGGWFGRVALDAAGAAAAIAEANAGDLLRRSGQLFSSGPTGTNVMDILIAYKDNSD